MTANAIEQIRLGLTENTDDPLGGSHCGECGCRLPGHRPGCRSEAAFAALARVDTLLRQLTTLVRVGFLVTVNGERVTADTVANPELRELLFVILGAEDLAAAVRAVETGQ